MVVSFGADARMTVNAIDRDTIAQADEHHGGGVCEEHRKSN